MLWCSLSGIAIAYGLLTVFDLEFHGNHDKHYSESAAGMTGNGQNGVPFTVSNFKYRCMSFSENVPPPRYTPAYHYTSF